MEHRDPDVDDTVVVDRSADDTIVVDRSAIADDTIVVDRSATADDTIVVDRAPRLLGIEDDDDEDDDDTDRSASRPSVDTDGDDTDRTVARPRDESADECADESADDTVSVDRSIPSIKLPPVPSLRRARVQRRRGIAPPPVPLGFAPAARPAVGPGAVDHYAPRRLVPPPAPLPTPAEGGPPARVIDPGLPSVARRTRRTAAVAFAVFAAACIVSVTGLTLILLWVL